MRLLGYAVRLAVTAAAVLTASYAAAGPAAATSPAGLCGGGFWQIDQHSLTYGTIYLEYNGKTDCVVTMVDPAIAPRKSAMNASVGIAGSSPHTDPGDFSYYAGPVKVDAPGKCIVWGGKVQPYLLPIGPPPNVVWDWYSGPSHCS